MSDASAPSNADSHGYDVGDLDTPPVNRPAEQAMIRETLALLRPRAGRLDDVPAEMVSMLLGVCRRCSRCSGPTAGNRPVSWSWSNCLAMLARIPGTGAPSDTCLTPWPIVPVRSSAGGKKGSARPPAFYTGPDSRGNADSASFSTSLGANPV